MSGENWFRLLIVGIGLAGAGVILLIVYLVRARCPACRKRTIELDLAAGGMELSTGGLMFRCTACGAEYRRDQEGGPFIPRGAWEEGARGEVPKARALRRNRR